MESVASLFEGRPNLSWQRRAAYVAAGLSLAADGAQPRPNPLLNVLALAGGSYLAWSGYKGHCPIKATFFDAPGPARENGTVSGQASTPRLEEGETPESAGELLSGGRVGQA